MKRKSIIVIALFCSMFLLNVSASIKPDKINDAADEIALSREGGTTRSPETTMTTRSFAIQAAPVEVSAESDGDVVSINAQNYRGGVWVEIVGQKGEAVQTYFDVYDMGFGVVNISALKPGKYSIRIMIGSEVFNGQFNKKGNGYYK